MQDVIKQLEKMKVKKILIQVPEGLKAKAVEFSSRLEKAGFETVISCEENFGACDIRDDEAVRMGCGAVLHIGHNDFGIKAAVPVVYHDYYFDIDPTNILKKEMKKLGNYKRIGLFSSLQFLKAMDRAKKYLEKNGKKIVVGKEGMECEGQVLGCRLQNVKSIEDKVDCFLYVGAGLFHPLGAALETEKPVYTLDVEKRTIKNLKEEKMKYLKKRAWFESELEEAKTVGILVSWKKGQNRVSEAFKLKKKLEKNGKKVTILAFDKIDKVKIEGMKFDVLVTMACPRMGDEYIFH
ncbi:diphthamide biosynthesis enzyme Dph2 [Candidatus Micrarchaeota archaeon RBG_16_49_10]|nr:MAG: diphthamide biosynthesis enzyme Dph2 [Candidatus Micrarchaeota archaeon RBG_16_49_10]